MDAQYKKELEERLDGLEFYIIFLFALFLGIVFFLFWKIREPGLNEYNRHVCAVYGYYEDCKTKLPEELRLK